MKTHSSCMQGNRIPKISRTRKASTALRLLAVALASLMLSSVALAQRATPVTQAQPSPILRSGDLAQANTCPAPMTQKLVAKPTDGIEAADMPTQWQVGNGMNGTNTNTFYGHTFRWKTRGRCCQVTRAVLIVSFKALQKGSPNNSNAYNDAVHVVKNGLAGTNLPGGGVSGDGYIWQTLFPSGFPIGTTTSKTITITNPTILASGHLSFYVQDDTAITGATLAITGCCLNVERPVESPLPVDELSPGR